MTNVDEQGRPEPPLAGDEFDTLMGFLEYQRATFAWKCAGLEASSFGLAVAASSMTLGGMLKHLAAVEDSWFSEWLRGRSPEPPFDAVDWDPILTGTGIRPLRTRPSNYSLSGKTQWCARIS